MRNKKSVLKTLSVSYDCSNGAVTGIAGNVVTHASFIPGQIAIKKEDLPEGFKE